VSSKDMGPSAFAMHRRDRDAGAEVHLGLPTRQHSRVMKPQRPTPIQPLEEPLRWGSWQQSRGTHLVLIGSLADQRLSTLLPNDRSQRLTLTLGPRVGFVASFDPPGWQMDAPNECLAAVSQLPSNPPLGQLDGLNVNIVCTTAILS